MNIINFSDSSVEPPDDALALVMREVADIAKIKNEVAMLEISKLIDEKITSGRNLLFACSPGC